MFAINPNYNEIMLRQIKKESFLTMKTTSELRRMVRLKEVQKICPRCGAFLSISAKGCDNCLLQFNTSGRK